MKPRPVGAWPSLRAAARALGLTPEGLRRRILAGTPLDAPKRDRAEPRETRITDPSGRVWRSVAALASAYGLETETLRLRLARGIPIGAALSPRDRRKAGR